VVPKRATSSRLRKGRLHFFCCVDVALKCEFQEEIEGAGGA
jgi:hypothetical protein